MAQEPEPEPDHAHVAELYTPTINGERIPGEWYRCSKCGAALYSVPDERATRRSVPS
jgi:hypothetical protein